ncbi:lysozyme inhibitor LprI family protein [Rhizobiaceae bacterium n13]|uniref:Lysozyme inhibitor LprI family protein n=1 Tax=Ferirhizobium litorale TaxID=2927786 RepID=A0AAE3U2M6_9HYPH|nr:lysozyme inhibitor LprI family protein [Fererhizobium litorale]MDI7865156.1 lysozyme inhibitor LprI family protein [Fererhizobium litorale]MDI7922872.1 lysozyme inhibitor LprI family protein [Fererhizobium litorale]
MHAKPRNTPTLVIALLSAILAGTTLFAGPSHSASFDCDAQNLKPDEQAICANRALNDADVKMATTFQLLSGLLAMGARGTLHDEQSAWLKTRQACGGDVACLKAAYDARLKQLDQAYNNISRPL